MIKIVLDTNFLIYCAKQKIDYVEKINNLISSRHKLIVLSSVIEELKNIAEKTKKQKNKEAAALAVKIIENYVKKKKIYILKTEKNADEAITNLVKKDKEIIVATQDKELKEKLAREARILTIRQGKYLSLL